MCYCTIFFHPVVPLAIVSIPVNVTVNESGYAFFNLSFTGTNIINVTWFSPNNSVIYSLLPDITVSSIIYPTEALSTLSFRNIQRAESEGWYRCACFAFNNDDYAYVETNVFMFVQG